VAALVPFFPDLKILVDHTLHVMLFLSGVFFSGSSIPLEYQPYFYLNPMATILEAYRSVLMSNHWPNISDLALIGVLAAFANVGAYLLLARWDRLYPKVVP
jgi:lipopolysaccharide transport system permease protein